MAAKIITSGINKLTKQSESVQIKNNISVVFFAKEPRTQF
jgi:hypothetical protein